MSNNKVHISQIDTLVLVSATDSDALGIGASFIGDVIPVGGYTHIAGYAYSDVASASPGGVIIEQGMDRDDFPSGSPATDNVTISITAIAAGNITDNALQAQVVAPFARVIYVNGGSAQSSFRLHFSAKMVRGL